MVVGGGGSLRTFVIIKAGKVNSKIESNSITSIFLFIFCNFLSPLSFMYIVYFVALKIYGIKFYVFSQITITYKSTPIEAFNTQILHLKPYPSSLFKFLSIDSLP